MLRSRAIPQFSKLYTDFGLIVLLGKVNVRDPPIGPSHHYFKKIRKKVPRKVIKFPTEQQKSCKTCLPPGSNSRLHSTSSMYLKYKCTKLVGFHYIPKYYYIQLPLQNTPDT